MSEPQELPAPYCPKCRDDTVMVRGIAMDQTFTAGMPDFPGTNELVTMSPGGPGKVIPCLKCPECGHSVTMGTVEFEGSGWINLVRALAHPLQPK